MVICWNIHQANKGSRSPFGGEWVVSGDMMGRQSVVKPPLESLREKKRKQADILPTHNPQRWVVVMKSDIHYVSMIYSEYGEKHFCIQPGAEGATLGPSHSSLRLVGRVSLCHSQRCGLIKPDSGAHYQILTLVPSQWSSSKKEEVKERCLPQQQSSMKTISINLHFISLTN